MGWSYLNNARSAHLTSFPSTFLSPPLRFEAHERLPPFHMDSPCWLEERKSCKGSIMYFLKSNERFCSRIVQTIFSFISFVSLLAIIFAVFQVGIYLGNTRYFENVFYVYKRKIGAKENYKRRKKVIRSNSIGGLKILVNWKRKKK